ncbi:MAG: hypothetical protein Q9217_000578 [Psora testacea]
MTIGEAHCKSLSKDCGRGQPVTINLNSEDEYESDATLNDEEFAARFVTPTLTANSNIPLNSEPDPETDAIFRVLPTLSVRNSTLRAGKTIELTDGEFLRITSLVERRDTKDIVIRGLRLRRNSELGGILEKKKNEVTLILKYNVSDPRDIIRQSTESICLDDLVKIRDLVKTNQQFPALSYLEIDPDSTRMSKGWISSNCRLTCRWKLLHSRNNEGVLQALDKEECDDGRGLEDEALKFAFRGVTTKGGSCRQWTPGEEMYDREERVRCSFRDPLRFYHRIPRLSTNDGLDNGVTATREVDLTINGHLSHGSTRYMFGDCFCGAGGASRGAKAAGLRVGWGFDFDPAAIESYSLNFSGANCWAIAAHEFIMVIMEDLRVDILHLSPPCQPFAPCHTRAGKDDDMNQATFFAVAELIEKVKPRIITLEETFGLTRTVDNVMWFKAMVQMFTKKGYSVRWKVFNLCDFGLPQPRKRFFIFASCPGEPLPDFPEPTHCKLADQHLYPDRRPYMTVNEAITGIPTNISLHNPDTVQRLNNPPFDGNLPLRSTITCASGARYHPSGSRNFTLREIACLQGFPLEHEFGKTRVRKQIGNAVPPIVAKTFFEQIIKTLQKTDGV